MKRAWIFSLAALVLAGCGGSGLQAPGGGGGFATLDDTGSGPGPIVGTPVPASVRYGAMNKVRAKYDALVAANVKNVYRELQLVAYMKNLPEFAKAGLAPDGTLWGKFADNSFYLFSDRSVPDDFTPTPSRPRRALPALSQAAAPSKPLSATGASVEVVNSRKAFVFDTFDGSMGTPNEEITEMLIKRGYQVTSSAATLEALRTVRDAGALYFSSHGGQATHPSNPQARFWSVWSSTEATPENDTRYWNDIAAGRLVVFEAAYGKSLGPLKYVSRRYAITGDWVKYYQWSFSNRSIAFINCCWSDKGGFTAALRLLPRPASTTFGWDNAAHPEKAWRAARYLFDRALGTNLLDPKLVGGARPFPTDDVFAKEVELGYTDGTTRDYGACTLVKAGANIVLAPSIKRMEVFERGMEPAQTKPRLYIYGSLGTELPQAVKIEGVPVTSVSIVSENEWKCDIAASPGPGFAGRVEIVSAGGIKSNTPLITSWQGSFQYRGAPLTLNGNNVRGTIDFPVVYRADVHRFRETVDGELLFQPSAYARNASTSGANWKFTGALPGWVYTTPISGVLPFGLRGSPAPLGTGYIMDAKFDRKAGTAGFAVSFMGTYANYRIDPVPQTFTVVIPTDLLLVSRVPSGTDKYGAQIYPVRSIGQLRPDLTVPKQTFDGTQVTQMGTQLECKSLAPTYISSDRCEEDWP